MTPHAAVSAVNSDALAFSGPGDAFAGYGVIGLPFQSGHVLALRCFSSSSLGPSYTSVWHREPSGRWTFYSTVAPDCSCARYFGGQIYRNVVTPIHVTWTTPSALRVDVGAEVMWQITLRASTMTRLLSVVASLTPERAYRMPALHRGMALVVDAAFGADRIKLTGRTPNGHRFVMRPRKLWLVETSTALVSGRPVGLQGALEEQAALGDLLIPQQGLFAIASIGFERPVLGKTAAVRHGRPCSPAASVKAAQNGGRR